MAPEDIQININANDDANANTLTLEKLQEKIYPKISNRVRNLLEALCCGIALCFVAYCLVISREYNDKKLLLLCIGHLFIIFCVIIHKIKIIKYTCFGSILELILGFFFCALAPIAFYALDEHCDNDNTSCHIRFYYSMYYFCLPYSTLFLSIIPMMIYRNGILNIRYYLIFLMVGKHENKLCVENV